MKTIKKNDLRLDKEVISALTENDLGQVKGGLNTLNGCPPIVPNQTISCPTLNINCIKPITGIGCTVNTCNSDEFVPLLSKNDPKCYDRPTDIYIPVKV